MTSPSIPWYYMWSPKYAIFHNILYSNISDISGIPVHPLFFPQSAWEPKEGGIHFIDGNTIKLEVLVDALEYHKGEMVIISDADIIVLKPELLYDYLQDYMDNDITFMKNSREETDSNIGFGLVRSNDLTINFFKEMIHHIKTIGGHDQTLYNEWIAAGKFPGKHAQFSIPEMLQSNNFMIESRLNTENKPIIMIQMLCSNGGYEINAVEKLLTAIRFVDISDLIGLISRDVFELLKAYIPHVIGEDHPLLAMEYPEASEEGKEAIKEGEGLEKN